MGNCLTKKGIEGIDLSTKSLSISSKQQINTKLEDYKIKALIGSGTTSQVFLVQKRTSGKHFAMKVINKNDIKRKNETKHIKSERMILERLKNPFLIKFHHAFQTKTKLHLILEFANGGDLYARLNSRKKISEEHARFYAAEIICALQYLHENGLIFRGLKPEDVLLDKYGHIKLSDFGLAKSEASNSKSFWGSPLYLAPEIIKGEKQTKAIDWWSLGVLLYEMVTGEPPFWDDDGTLLLKSILKDSVSFNDDISDDVKDLITKLLRNKVNERIGSGETGVEEIKDHPFFKSINWTDIYMKRVRPPFIPLIRSESDINHVDNLFKSGQIGRASASKDFWRDSSATVYENYTFVGGDSSTVGDECESPEFNDFAEKTTNINTPKSTRTK